ncbi:hypothetical protein PoB_005431500 [Plakobranchus ocellatus]|uniref:Uncharacterized protein n=1 Tax=Plakobranchus ocellatus TaxID=259542 RepID=A0AAV4C8T4_9GAST|nr:hypothetical protein PoB_005431500 [Plakobranchus ocellatus]
MKARHFHALLVFLDSKFFVAFVFAFAFYSWVSFDDRGEWIYGLWEICYKGDNFKYKGEHFGLRPDPDNECKSIKISADLYGFCRVMYIIALSVCGMALLSRLCTCVHNKSYRTRRCNLIFEVIVALFMLAGSLTFHFHKGQYDNDHSVESTYGFIAYMMFGVCGVHGLCTLLISFLFIRRAYNFCSAKCSKVRNGCCTCTCRCGREESRSDVSSASSTLDDTEVTRESEVVASHGDVRVFDAGRPSSSRQHYRGMNTAAGRSNSRSPNINPLNSNGVADAATVNDEDVTNAIARNSVFTIMVSPAPYSLEPPAVSTTEQPPPPYEDLNPEPAVVEGRSSIGPPPSYERTISGDGSSRSSTPHRPDSLDSRLHIGTLSPPPAYSEV